MLQAILILDYEPRTAARVTEALAGLGFQVMTAKDVDTAVAACAKVEPQAVLTTSVLPRLKVEDAITQLRARAGLRNIPFLVLMSGYTGHDPVVDAQKLGAQDIIAKPFSNDELIEHVRALLDRPRPEAVVRADTRAELLEALKRAGAGSEPGTVTSKDLFGDLLAEEQSAGAVQTQRIDVPAPTSAGDKPPGEPQSASKPVPVSPDADAVVEKALASTLAEMQSAGSKLSKPHKESAEVSVDKLLEDTLSGLDISKPRPAAKPAPPPEPSPAPEEPVAIPPAVSEQPVEASPKPASAPGVTVPGVEHAPTPLPSGTPFGQYELTELIATGGMAEVYRARMQGVEGFQKIVAIKRILPHLTDNEEFVRMFVDEAKVAAQLQHPNIIHIYDLGKIERSYFIAMEYIDGRDLRSILRTLEEKRARLPLGLALFITSRLAAALDYAHRKHDLQGKAMTLVHRDISPQNVLISYDGDIKLCDFGIAKAASKASHTRAGALKGKLQYMSPEQAWGKDIDSRSDIFSLGLVLYEMLTGRKGFAGDSELSILEQVRTPRLIPPRELDPAIPPEVERVVMRALKEKREERYQSAAELAADLGTMLQVIRPTPGATELGAFLTDLVGRERAVGSASVPAPRPAITPPPRPAPPPLPPRAARPKPAPQPSAGDHVGVETPPVLTAPSQSRAGLMVGIGVLVVAIVAGVLYVTHNRHGGPGAAAEATPAPETVEMAREVAQQEVAKQTQALRERLSNEILNPTAVPAPRRQAPAPQRAAAVVPTQQASASAAVATQESPVPASAAVATQQRPAPAEAAAQPPGVVPAPTEVPTAVPAAIAPTEAPPTQVPATPTFAPPPTQVPVVEAPPKVRAGDLVALAGDVIPPEPMYTPTPAYPPVAERQHIEGTVLLDVLVDENGSVQDIKVLRGVKPDLGLDAAAVDAVRTWRYRPATKEGVRVKVRTTLAITFKLKP
jgi:TonB family protein